MPDQKTDALVVVLEGRMLAIRVLATLLAGNEIARAPAPEKKLAALQEIGLKSIRQGTTVQANDPYGEMGSFQIQKMAEAEFQSIIADLRQNLSG